jgi:hypothetical protein
VLRIALLSALVLLLIAAPTNAKHGTVTGYEASLPVVSVPMPPQLHVELRQCPYEREYGVSCADLEAATIWLGIRDRFTRWHEIGHLYDYQMLTDQDRAVLGRMMGGGWGLERFADAYAACALELNPGGYRRGRVRIMDWRTEYGYWPTDRQHARVCEWLRAKRPRPLTVTAPS